MSRGKWNCQRKGNRNDKNCLNVAMSVLLAGTVIPSFGQEGRIQQHKENQQQRIGNGVKNGSLTAGETSHLEKKESNLNKEIHHDRKQNGGNLTNKEKAQVDRQQNRVSKDIYRDKHNGKAQN
jgi:hypothetical protein